MVKFGVNIPNTLREINGNVAWKLENVTNLSCVITSDLRALLSKSGSNSEYELL